MPLRPALELLNRMRTDGVIGQYAIGGAVGATFYLEPAATIDVDVFVRFPQESGSSLVSLSPIYEYCEAHGGKVQGEHIVVGDWPVQFLLASDALECDALAEAVQTEVEGIPTWVMCAEHLVAIALRTGRAKDHARIVQFIEQNAIDNKKLESILVRHGLSKKWRSFKRRYLEGAGE